MVSAPGIYLCRQAVDVATTRILHSQRYSLSLEKRTWKLQVAAASSSPEICAAPHRRQECRNTWSVKGRKWRGGHGGDHHTPALLCSALLPVLSLAQQRFSREPRNQNGGLGRVI